MASFNHTRCPQVGPGASSLAPAGGKFEGALGVPKAGQGARLGLSGTTYVNDVFSLKVSCFRLMLTPKAISLVVHPPFSNPRFLWTPRVRGTRLQFEGCPTKGKTRFPTASVTCQGPWPGKAPDLHSPPGMWHLPSPYHPSLAARGSAVTFSRLSTLSRPPGHPARPGHRKWLQHLGSMFARW